MNSKTKSSVVHVARKLLPLGTLALGLLVAPCVGQTATNLVLAFSSPATNASHNATFVGDLTYSPPGMAFSALVTSGTGIVPQANLTFVTNATTVTVSMVPLSHQSGTVSAEVTGTLGDWTNRVPFDVHFLPCPPVVITPAFASPVTNSAPGATFSGQVGFAPTGTVFTLAATSGGSLLQTQAVTPLNPTNVTVSLEPKPNVSGSVTMKLTGTTECATNNVSFTVVFKTYPPVLGSIADVTMNEDGNHTVSFTVSDPDTTLSSLTFSASSDTPSLIDTADMTFGGSGGNRTLRLEPKPDENNPNAVAIITVTVSDGENSVSRSFELTVNPRPDSPTVSGGTGAITYDTASTNLLPGITVGDVDHNKPDPESLTATVTLSDGFATFTDGSLVSVVTGSPSAVQTALRNLLFTPFANLTPPGTTNTLNYTVRIADGTFSPVFNRSAKIISANDNPTVEGGISPTSVVEGQSVAPFFVTSISDVDKDDTSFDLAVQLVDSAQSTLGTLSSPSVISNANFAAIQTFLGGLTYTAASGVIAGLSATVQFRYLVNDGFGGSTAVTYPLTIYARQTAPSIYGVPIQTLNLTDGATPQTVFPTVGISDPDDGGNQLVRATLTSSSPVLGTLSTTNFALMSPADLTTALRGVTFAPRSGILPINTTSNTVITITVTDATGLNAINSNLLLAIKAVNNPPQILGVPDVALQPLLLPPVSPILPFAALAISSDDAYSVTVQVSLDNATKGTLSNLGGFSLVSAGVYAMTGTTNELTTALRGLTYVLDEEFLFPVDDPGGTVFTITAADFALLTQTRTLHIQIQSEPRNHLVTRTVADGAPGSLTYALANAGNNDVITFALPAYPATIRLPGTLPSTLVRNLTLKGPGANLLTLSGDGDGNWVPDRQLFVIQSRVTMEGLTLADGVAAYGGAIQVQEGGFLTLRDCAVVDSMAAYYGGGIDVDGGRLLIEGCFVGRNWLSDEEGVGGAGVSLYTDEECSFLNTTFAQNWQANENGAGGGALIVENRDPVTIQNTYLTHCTFAENVDAAGTASAVFSISFGTRVQPRFCIFRDLSGRNIDVDGTGAILSLGGNVCDDSSRTVLTQQGQSEGVYLLNHATDLVRTNALLGTLASPGAPTPYYPLLSGSPAIGRASASTWPVDQRGALRASPAEAGAIEFGAARRLVINELDCDDTTLDFVELYVPRDSAPLDLAPFALFVDNVKVHEFGNSRVIGTPSLPYDSIASTLVNPGFGFVVAFTNGALTLVSASNPTPVVRPSITNANLRARGIVSIGLGGATPPIVSSSYLATYLNPQDGTNVLDTTGSSITLAPQFVGHALVPHDFVEPGPFGGVDATRTIGSNPNSPGADADGTPFGQNNAEPLARQDYFTVNEDDWTTLGVLANDMDADGNDRVVIVDVSSGSAPDAGDAFLAASQFGAVVAVTPASLPIRGSAVVYDPRAITFFQALPAGGEVLDSFFYEVLDVGHAPVDGYAAGPGSSTVVVSSRHRLTNEVVTLSGSSITAYNGTHAITVLDEDRFTIPVLYAGVPATLGFWTTAATRTPSSRDEAPVTVKVVGVNDPPVSVGDLVTNVTEASTVRILVRPELLGTPLSFPTDPLPTPPTLSANLLTNDTDVDSDDTWASLRVVGVLGAVNAIADFSGTVGQSPVTVRSPAHGLSTGTEVLIANYGGHPSYNGYHVATVVDADTFTVPRFFVDNFPMKGLWVVLNDASRYHATTDVGATVDLTLRDDPREDHLVYDAAASAFLNGLAEGEIYTNRFYQAVADSHGAIGIGTVDVVVVGLNDTPVAPDDPPGLGILDPLVGPGGSLSDVLADGLDLLYHLPRAASAPPRADVHVLDRTDVLPGILVLPDLWFTDEATAIAVDSADLLANDSDVDRLDGLSVIGVEPFSREGAALSLAGGQITFDPTVSANLQALARDELVIDTFHVAVSDAMTGGTVTSLVAVLVVGLNDRPVAQPDWVEITEDDVFQFNPLVHPAGTPALHDFDVDINAAWPDDRLALLIVSNLMTLGEARVDLDFLLAQYDATVSQILNQLADWQTYTDSFDYTITDNSFLFVVPDEFYVPAGTVGRALDVLANDRDFTPSPTALTVVEVGPTLLGGAVAIGPDGKSVVYDSPEGMVGDDYFRYVVENERGARRGARVRVRSVVPVLNGILNAAEDRYTVAYGTTAVLDVLANDNMLPAGSEGLVLATNLVATSLAGQPVRDGNRYVFTATHGLTPLVFTYEVNAGGPSVARANVVVNIVDRRGTLPVQNDAFSVMAASLGNELDVLANDSLVTGSTASLRVAELLDAGAFGTATTNATATALVYSPNPGFVGVEQLRYLATDGIGGTGTGIVTIAVGQVDVVSDYYTVAASAGTTFLDVLANDRVLPYPSGALTLLSVAPTDSTIGRVQVGGGGSRLEFTPTNVLGQVDFDYVVADSTARVATGRVTVATVPAGIYANADRFGVRARGTDYELDVLANDRSFPEAGKTYSVISIGTDGNGPNQGGTAVVVGNTVRYTPAATFVGQESFTYTMSDSVQTDTALVTVTVRPGDLVANEDRFAVFYELQAGGSSAKSFVLPVVLNDRIQPALDQVVQITGIGVAANAPSLLGEVGIGADGISLTYRPVEVPASLASYVERFTYEISDGTARRASAVVEVRVTNRATNLQAITHDDAFTVARNSVNNLLPVLRNDAALPGTTAGWTVTQVSASQYGATLSLSGTSVRYAPAEGFVGLDQFTYHVNDGLGGTGSATVRVRVGAMPTLPDLFVALSGTQDNVLDVVANDALFGDYAEEYTLQTAFGATQGGSVAVDLPGNRLLYTPNPLYAGSYPYWETFLYTVSDDASGSVTGRVVVVVHETGSDRDTTTVTLHVLGRNDRPVILNTPPNAPLTDKQTATPFTGVTIVEVDQQLQEPIDVLVAIDDAVKGALINLGAFVDLGGGQYALTNVTAAVATAAIRALVYQPVENRITVPTTEDVTFTITVTDHKSPPVVDAQTVLAVTAVNDPPWITGTRAGQRFYYLLPVLPFSEVTVGEVDDLTLQPLAVTIALLEPARGELRNLGSFISLGAGNYLAAGLTAAQVTAELRAIEFSAGTNVVAIGASLTAHLHLSVTDGFATPVVDTTTSVTALNGYGATVRPTSDSLLGSLGLAVDTIATFAVAGAPTASARGTNAGAALLYKHVPGSTNVWLEHRQLLPASVGAGDRFGRSVSLNDDWLAVGAPEKPVGGGAAGSVYLFRRSEGGEDNWGEWSRFSPTNTPGASRFGQAVALSGDLLAVGAPDATISGGATSAGAVFLFGRHQGGADAWGELMRWSPAAAGSTDADFGWSVALTDDTLIVGAPAYNSELSNTNREGAVFHFARNQGGSNRWGLQATYTAAETTVARAFGWSVAVNNARLAVGAPEMIAGSTAAGGRVYLYRRAATTDPFAGVVQLDRRSDVERRFGYSVAIDGKLLLVGAPENNTLPNLGAAYLYEDRTTSGGVWTLVQKFNRPSGSTANLYGRAVGFRQGSAIVGAPASDTPTSAKGQAFLYRFDYLALDGRPLATLRAAWDRLHFGDNLGNPWTVADLWGASANPDGDPASNDQEYAFVGDPNVSDDPGRLSIEQDVLGRWVLEYVRRSNDATLDFTIEWSVDWIEWHDVEPYVEEERTAFLSSEAELATVVAQMPIAWNPVFFRVKVVW